MYAELFVEIRAFQKFDVRSAEFKTQSRQVAHTMFGALWFDNRNAICIIRNTVQVSFVSNCCYVLGTNRRLNTGWKVRLVNACVHI